MKNIRKGMVACVLAVVAIAWVAPPRLNAQVSTGAIIGTVKDPNGGLLPNVNIRVRSVETGVTRATTADNNGEYRVPSLPPGSYDIEASLQGFTTRVRSGMTVTVSATSKVDFVLSVGSMAETVKVTAEAPQVDSTSAAMGELVGEQAIRELPLNGRDWLQLATLQAGVVG
jgi:hypothetical protein